MIPKRIVIDTNVCLDLFVFRDPRWSALTAALQSGEVEAVTRADCRMEWQLVLHYSHLPINDETRPGFNLAFETYIKYVEPEALSPRTDIRLPICSDPDDQKFLELALDTHATTLITKDKALLKLARKTAKLGLFSIIPPQSWQLPQQ
ncbi:putative toxin-antitoxin system toxin component, PIN family [Glaciimonas sp. Gout2]|uniref:putative toxin-antitoxin system toxin component, PIN family n=1 Tax=unclassified Glaciimonas TaxID=2644401 RepID=UPI002B228116|nr:MULTISPECIES: putative toxin-antitoxin system toxin component, PIN family [unclassified Glaciimonas]MEB0011915.1 putative toxin-antitoxin system toxin component, PIN family [Glaciimonas sp. Cout2]MEB0082850.1 putative toxin-antitoxin system toxin component, PIN family [Glaciimonas sp. Gout2]